MTRFPIPRPRRRPLLNAFPGVALLLALLGGTAGGETLPFAASPQPAPTTIAAGFTNPMATVPYVQAPGGETMKRLVSGVHRFRHQYFNDNRELYTRLAHEQRPEVLFITCADSRVLPNELTQTKAGELFCIRNAGNIVPPFQHARQAVSGEAATLQYAVEILGVKEIVVCGHTDCGAVKALMAPHAAHPGAELVAGWIAQASHLRDIVAVRYGDRTAEQRLLAAVETNVRLQLDGVRSYPFIQERVATGELRLHGWVYHIADGEVHAYDPNADRFVPVGAGEP